MKKIIKLFPTFIFMLLTLLLISYIDINEKINYDRFKSYNLIGFEINPNNENITSDIINDIFHIAKEKDILLVKDIFNENSNSTDLYVSTKDLFKLYDSKFKVEKLNEVADNSFIATFKTDNQKQSHYIPDFLNNDRFVFYLTDAMEENNVYRYGSYSLFYENHNQLQIFIDDVAKLLNEPKDKLLNDNWGQLSSHADMLLTAIVICILFIFLFYLITIFQLYKESKKIGCLLLLGFNKFDIMVVMMKANIKILVFSSLCYFCLCSFLISNNHLFFMIVLLLLYVIMITLTIIISYLGILFVCKYSSISNILKKSSLVNNISKLFLFSKFIMVGIIILFVISFIPIIKDSYMLTQNLKESKLLMDYAVFPRFDVENSEYDKDENYLTFFRSLEDFGIDYIYVDFRDYLITDEASLDTFESQEAIGETFRTASIDRNYLKKHSIEIYDLQNQKIDYNTNHTEMFLLPDSKQGYYERLYNWVKKRNTRLNIDSDVNIYFYKDSTLRTYDAIKGIQSVESPILRVINKNYNITYFQNYTGLDIAGTGMNTALKIDISTGKDQVLANLQACLENANLQETLTNSNFISYQDFYNDELGRLRKNNMFFIVGMSLLLSIYITLVIQTFILYIESKMNRVLVKVLLGHDRKNIFNDIIYLNIGVSFMVIIGLVAYDITSGNQDFWINFAVYLGFLLVDIVLLIVIANFIKLNKVYTKLKGE